MESADKRRERLYERPSYRAITMRIAANTRRLRESKGWTQVQAAVRAEMATYLLQRVESGKFNVTTTTLARLCDAFGADVVEFFQPAPELPKPTKGRPPRAPKAPQPPRPKT